MRIYFFVYVIPKWRKSERYIVRMRLTMLLSCYEMSFNTRLGRENSRSKTAFAQKNPALMSKSFFIF